jgi:hypothetical protein
MNTGYVRPKPSREKSPERLAELQVHHDRVLNGRLNHAANMLADELKNDRFINQDLLKGIVILLRQAANREKEK